MQTFLFNNLTSLLTAFKYLKYFDLFRKRYQLPLKDFFYMGGGGDRNCNAVYL